MEDRAGNDEVSKVSPQANEADDLMMLQGQAQMLRRMFAFVDSMVLKCVVELRIADIIHSHGRPITLPQIATSIPSQSLDIACLARIMRFLVHSDIFTAAASDGGGETLYGLTPSARWLLHDAELSLAPLLLQQVHPSFLAPWHCFGTCLKEGGSAFEKAHGHQLWDFASRNPEFNKLFNDAMASWAKNVIKGVISAYQNEFSCIGTLVDVGGGTGAAAAEMVKAYPHIKAINFDLPHVIATAPAHERVTHVGGDMFESIPNADAIFMKSIMHDWNDQDCVKILKNCRKAIPEKFGKIIIVDAVIREDGDDAFEKTRLAFDLLMMVNTRNGKERTEAEWKKLLGEGGFPRYRIIKIPTLEMIIEAHAE